MEALSHLDMRRNPPILYTPQTLIFKETPLDISED